MIKLNLEQIQESFEQKNSSAWTFWLGFNGSQTPTSLVWGLQNQTITTDEVLLNQNNLCFLKDETEVAFSNHLLLAP